MTDAAHVWTDGWYASGDGLRLHWREIGPAGGAAPVLLCIPGLTRTAKDFYELGERLADCWRVVAVDLRGRGDSAWPKEVGTYGGTTYIDDLRHLIDAAGIGRYVVLGSSIGGLLAIRLAAEQGGCDGVILNDIGPNIAPEGLARLRGNAGRQVSWPTWVHAAREFAVRHADIYPGWGLDQWLGFAKKLCRISASGRIVFDYDPRIAEPFRVADGDPAAASWAALAALHSVPLLSLRAERSDVLTHSTQVAMAAKLPQMSVVQVPATGHAPTLAEAEAIAAIEAFLGRLSG